MMFKQLRDARKARRAYGLVRLESLIAELRAQSEQVEECPVCKALEVAEQRAVCVKTVGAHPEEEGT